MAHVCNGRQGTDGGFDGLTEIRAIHGCSNIERTEVAGNVLAEMLIRKIIIEDAGFAHLKNFRAEIAHGDAAINRIGAVHRVFEHDVRIAGLKLDFR